MKQANGMGSVCKLSGNRRKPYAVRITVGTEYNESTDTYTQKRKIIGYYATQNEARKALALYNDNPCDAKMLDVTFCDVWQIISPNIQSKISKSRYDAYNSAYKKCDYIHNKKMREIRTADLQRVIDGIKTKSGTKSDVKTVMGKIFEYCMQNDIVSKDYSRFVKFEIDDVSIKRELFSHDAVSRLRMRPNEWQFDLMLILLFTGARINEIVSNTKSNVNLKDRTIYVDESIAKNKSSVRFIPIHKEIMPIIEKHMNAPGPYLICKPNGNKIEYKNFMSRDIKMVNEWMQEEHTPHDTRHTFITRAHESNIDNLVIQRIVGHTPDTITQSIYTHISNEELLKAVDSIIL